MTVWITEERANARAELAAVPWWRPIKAHRAAVALAMAAKPGSRIDTSKEVGLVLAEYKAGCKVCNIPGCRDPHFPFGQGRER